MPPVHQCSQWERLQKLETTLDLTNETVMKEISEIKSDVKDIKIYLLEKMPITYATKIEADELWKEVDSIKNNTNSTRVEWIKVWGWWIAAVIGWFITLLTLYLSK